MILASSYPLYWLLLSAIPALYLALVIAFFLAQRKFIYRRPRSDETAPDLLDSISDGEFITLKTEDGESIIAWHRPARAGAPIVLFLHGSADSPTHRATRFLALANRGFGILAPYFRGFGRSTGSPSEAGLLFDASAAYAFCRRSYTSERIFVWGFSLGSAVAITLAKQQRVAGLVLEAPFTSLAAVVRRTARFLPIKLILRDKYNIEGSITSVAAPILIIHGGSDRESPVVMAERLFGLAATPKFLVRFDAGGHADLDRYGALTTVIDFITNVSERAPDSVNGEMTKTQPRGVTY